jgi:hypothetical protein
MPGRSAAVKVNVIKPVLALCGREKVLPEVSHVSLTHRGAAEDAVVWDSVDRPRRLRDYLAGL